ncbi:site-specific integrase [Salinigranum halophilum]|uniref:hypothetical protein n=1 Tax=Salinigranum halophilum TaxID=2565931 RepID=UPI00191BD5F0|nr:hypothetical protein [Salinigranum halophilum]
MALEPLDPDTTVEPYLEDHKSELATQYAHSSRLGHLIRWCDEQDIDNLNDLTGRTLHRYRLRRRADGDLAPPSEKSQMDTLRVFIRWFGTIDADVPEPIVSAQANVSTAVLDEHYDRRTQREKIEQRRKYLDQI